MRQLLHTLEKVDPEVREAFLLLLEEMESWKKTMASQVSRDEFGELKQIVAELAEAQKRTEAKVAELAEAQKRTDAKVAELAEAQKRTEAKVAELAEAQKRTEAKVAELAEAQKQMAAEFQRFREETATEFQKVWKAIYELTEAQKRTEEELRHLTIELRQTKERVEGVSNAVGYTLEDRAMQSLPSLLRQQGIEVEGRLIRRYLLVGEVERQLNIYGYGKRDEQRVLIIGEAKVRPSRKEIDRFAELAAQLEADEGLPTVRLFVAYDFPPSIEAYLREKSILPIWSYELAL